MPILNMMLTSLEDLNTIADAIRVEIYGQKALLVSLTDRLTHYEDIIKERSNDAENQKS